MPIAFAAEQTGPTLPSPTATEDMRTARYTRWEYLTLISPCSQTTRISLLLATMLKCAGLDLLFLTTNFWVRTVLRIMMKNLCERYFQSLPFKRTVRPYCCTRSKRICPMSLVIRLSSWAIGLCQHIVYSIFLDIILWHASLPLLSLPVLILHRARMRKSHLLFYHLHCLACYWEYIT